MCGTSGTLWHYHSLGFEGKLIFSSFVPTAEFSKFTGAVSSTAHILHSAGVASG